MAVAGNGAAEVAAAVQRPRVDVISKKEQEKMLELRGPKHAARMACKERLVPARTARKKLEMIVHRYKKSMRSNVFKEDIWKQDLIEVAYNDGSDKRAQILFLLEGQEEGKKVMKQLNTLYSEYEDIMRKVYRKREKIEELGFTLDAVPACFDRPPRLLPK